MKANTYIYQQWIVWIEFKSFSAINKGERESDIVSEQVLLQIFEQNIDPERKETSEQNFGSRLR